MSKSGAKNRRAQSFRCERPEGARFPFFRCWSKKSDPPLFGLDARVSSVIRDVRTTKRLCNRVRSIWFPCPPPPSRRFWNLRSGTINSGGGAGQCSFWVRPPDGQHLRGTSFFFSSPTTFLNRWKIKNERRANDGVAKRHTHREEKRRGGDHRERCGVTFVLSEPRNVFISFPLADKNFDTDLPSGERRMSVKTLTFF
jgi:hypothetical protein